jgi:Flavin containing amine oxidoreductase
MIVGAGIAGLHCALELQRRDPRASITLFEKYKYDGGRIFTFHTRVGGRPYHWESGAGRISSKHKMVLKYMKRYGLTYVPIPPTIQYRETACPPHPLRNKSFCKDGTAPLEPNWFEAAIPAFLEPIGRLPPAQLASATLRQLCEQVHGRAATDDFLIRFPYRSEVDVMRADEGLALFRCEMGSHEGYGICAEGLSALVERMRAEFVRGGGTVKNRHTLLDIAETTSYHHGGGAGGRLPPENDGIVHAVFKAGEKTVTWTAGRSILALHSEALRKIPRFAGWWVLKHLTMEPLLRVYAVYKAPGWFQGLSRVVTDGPLRYFLPSDPSTGQAMISYTDSRDARPLMEKTPAALEKFIQAELRRLFPDRHIPEPLFFKSHPWKFGVTYWLPADYNVAEASRAAWTVGQRIHVCGESFSQRQGWMEGALEHADGLLRFLDAQ